MESFENLHAWKEAHKLVLMVYKETKSFPSEERYRLIDQICRSSSSIAANLAEGNARTSKKEYLQFINQAKGSLEETKYHLLLARDLKYLSVTIYEVLIEQTHVIGRLLSGLQKYFKSHIS